MIKKIGNDLYKSKLIRSNDIEIRASQGKGYGVFAINEIPKDTIIEECVVAADRLPHTNHALIHYKFFGQWINKTDWDEVMPLGIACVLNNDENPNCIIEQDTNYERIVRIKTIKQVLPNDELTHKYYKT